MFRKKTAWRRLAVILIPVLGLAGCDSARHDAQFWEKERETIELTHRLKLAEYRLSGARTSAGNSALIRNKLRGQERAKQDLLRMRTELTAQIDNLENQFGELARAEIRKRRQHSVGEKYDTLTRTDGRVFKNVTVSAVTDAGVAIRHEDGAARLGFEDLTPAQRHSFGLDEASALAARQREAREAHAYEKQIDDALQVQRGKQELAAAAQRRRDDRASRTLMARNATQPRDSPLSMPATSVAGRSWSSRSYYRSYRPSYRYVYSHTSARNPFACGGNYRASSCTSIAPLPRIPGRVMFSKPTAQ
jgi:hypothetical protein